MGIIDRLLGRDEDNQQQQQQRVPMQQSGAAGYPQQQGVGTAPAQDPDAAAIERYRYMLRTAPPDMVEQAHAQAFAQLTPEQRRQVLQEMSQNIPPAERPQNDDPQSLARAATRAEVRQPGFMERTFGGAGMGGGMGMMGGAGPGMGAIIGGSLLSSIAGSFIGSSIAHSFFDHNGFGPDVVNNYYGSDGNDAAPNNDTNNELNQDDATAFNGADTQGDGFLDSDTEGMFGGDMDLGGGGFGGDF